MYGMVFRESRGTQKFDSSLRDARETQTYGVYGVERDTEV